MSRACGGNYLKMVTVWFFICGKAPPSSCACMHAAIGFNGDMQCPVENCTILSSGQYPDKSSVHRLNERKIPKNPLGMTLTHTAGAVCTPHVSDGYYRVFV